MVRESSALHCPIPVSLEGFGTQQSQVQEKGIEFCVNFRDQY